MSFVACSIAGQYAGAIAAHAVTCVQSVPAVLPEFERCGYCQREPERGQRATVCLGCGALLHRRGLPRAGRPCHVARPPEMEAEVVPDGLPGEVLPDGQIALRDANESKRPESASTNKTT